MVFGKLKNKPEKLVVPPLTTPNESNPPIPSADLKLEGNKFYLTVEGRRIAEGSARLPITTETITYIADCYKYLNILGVGEVLSEGINKKTLSEAIKTSQGFKFFS